jgi:hypothetical protein
MMMVVWKINQTPMRFLSGCCTCIFEKKAKPNSHVSRNTTCPTGKNSFGCRWLSVLLSCWIGWAILYFIGHCRVLRLPLVDCCSLLSLKRIVQWKNLLRVRFPLSFCLGNSALQLSFYLRIVMNNVLTEKFERMHHITPTHYRMTVNHFIQTPIRNSF